MTDGPVEAAFDVYADFLSYKSGKLGGNVEGEKENKNGGGEGRGEGEGEGEGGGRGGGKGREGGRGREGECKRAVGNKKEEIREGRGKLEKRSGRRV